MRYEAAFSKLLSDLNDAMLTLENKIGNETNKIMAKTEVKNPVLLNYS
jgi:hypothetical protein